LLIFGQAKLHHAAVQVGVKPPTLLVLQLPVDGWYTTEKDQAAVKTFRVVLGGRCIAFVRSGETTPLCAWPFSYSYQQAEEQCRSWFR
jgi:hypothetical protein